MTNCDSILMNPCTSCKGNDNLCSNEDSTLPYNSLTCNLIIEYVTRNKPGRPSGSPNKTRRMRTTLQGVTCKYCQSSQTVKKGVRQTAKHIMQTLWCYDCLRRWSIRKID